MKPSRAKAKGRNVSLAHKAKVVTAHKNKRGSNTTPAQKLKRAKAIAVQRNTKLEPRLAGRVRDMVRAPQVQAVHFATGLHFEGKPSYVVRASDIEPTPISWLWPGRIARGKLTMLVGNPCLGKSQITASMSAVVSTGASWPDGTECEPGNVIILSAEDNAADTIRPRLEAAQADLSKVFLFNTAGNRAFNLKDGLTRLVTTLHNIGGAGLVIIDPISAYLGDADSHKNAVVRNLLAPLSDLAEEHDAAIVCVSHLNKMVTKEVMAKVSGSVAFVAAARAAFIVMKDGSNDGQRVFLPIKNNIGNDQTGLAFSVQPAEVQSDAGAIQTSRIVWEEEPVAITVEEVMKGLAPAKRETATDQAEEWLIDFLRAGPIQAAKVQEEANLAGITAKALRTARERLHIDPAKQGFSGGWWWRLPECEDDQSAEEAQATGEGSLKGNGHLQKQPVSKISREDAHSDEDAHGNKGHLRKRRMVPGKIRPDVK